MGRVATKKKVNEREGSYLDKNRKGSSYEEYRRKQSAQNSSQLTSNNNPFVNSDKI